MDTTSQSHSPGLAGVSFRNGVSDKPGRTEKARGGLAGWQIRRIEQLAASGPRDLSPKLLAAEVRLSPYHFARAFRSSMGLSPGKWLTKLKVDRAKALLADSALSVDEIAREVGYSGAAQLARAFRAWVGLTPRAYRRR